MPMPWTAAGVLIEQRAALAARGFDKAVNVHLADTTEKREDACVLINRRYAWRGYGDHHTLPSHRGCATFAASDEAGTLGTVTLVVDSEARLAADRIFPDALDSYRNTPGRKICELSRLAFESGLPSKPLLAALFHIVFIYGYHHHRCTDLFIEVNPRHRRFYEAMLGFKSVGAVRTNMGVGAPSQLMWLEIATIRRRMLEAQWDIASGPSRSLYALFFSDDDAATLAETLTADKTPAEFCQNGPMVRIFVPEG